MKAIHNSRQVQYLTAIVVNIKKRLKSFEKIENTIAFFGNELKIDVKIPEIQQIEDYGKN